MIPLVTEAADARQGIQSVELAMTVLLALEDGLGPMSLTQIATASGMGVSKAHRYLVSLGRIGLVAQSRSTGLYDLGPSMRRLGMEALRRMDEVGVASEYLPGLRDRTRHAVNLAVWGDHGPVIVRWDYGAYALPITVRVGATLPMLSSSVGRVYLAHLPETLTGPVVRGEQASAHEPLSADELTRIRDAVRREGVALTSGGVIPGVTSVAAPVFAAGESLPLVVALALPAREATEEVLAFVTDELRRTTAAMSVELGDTAAARRG
jgi:DNA-binding IclR family transcriptional regulator